MDATNNRTVLKKCAIRGVAGDPQKKSVCYGFFFKRENNYDTVLIKYAFGGMGVYEKYGTKIYTNNLYMYMYLNLIIKV